MSSVVASLHSGSEVLALDPLGGPLSNTRRMPSVRRSAAAAIGRGFREAAVPDVRR
jgi:hypothetical protein